MKTLLDRRPTIADVAQLAKVSTATVSRALQTPEIVSESTRAAVMDAVQATGYRGNSVAKMLRQNRSGAILVLLPDLANPFFSEILSGIDEVATESRYTILVGNTFRDTGDKTRALLDNLWNGRADGGLLLNGALPHALPKRAEAPLISISEAIPGAGIPHVGTDNVQAARDATRHLIDLGHRRIGFISGPTGNVLSQARRDG